MNIFNFPPLASMLSWALQQARIGWLESTLKFMPDNWTDKKGNNLYHFASRHQSEYLFKAALLNHANINQFNKTGIAPIHRLIEAAFIIEKNDNKEDVIKFEFNLELLKKFIQTNVDINLWMKKTDPVGTYTKKDNKGSPIELLIELFWEQILTPKFDFSEQVLNHYQEVYDIFSQAGANINLIVESGFLFEGESQLDAMQVQNSVIVSHFFIKFISTEINFEAIRPLLKDPKLDLALRDDQMNTFLHHFFSRISRKYYDVSSEKIYDFLDILYNNPAFKKEYLDIENSFRLTPLSMFKKDSKEYASYLTKRVLTEELLSNLSEKKETVRIKKHKI